MRKIQLLGVAFLALFAFGALTATSAMAVTLLAEWLLNGSVIPTETLVEIDGELLLEDTKGVIGTPAAVLCSGSLDGWVGPNSLAYISEILTLSGVAISTSPLTGESLSCSAETGCETNTAVLMWPVGLPWESESNLLEQESPVKSFFSDFVTTKANGGKFGWEITNCLVLGSAHEDECLAERGVAEIKLSGATLLGIVSFAFLALNGLSNATCVVGGANTGVVAGEGEFLLTGELDPSSGA